LYPATARLPRLVGRGRALEALLVADDPDCPRAELYGYVERATADAALDDEVDAIASRLARFVARPTSPRSRDGPRPQWFTAC